MVIIEARRHPDLPWGKLSSCSSINERLLLPSTSPHHIDRDEALRQAARAVLHWRNMLRDAWQHMEFRVAEVVHSGKPTPRDYERGLAA